MIWIFAAALMVSAGVFANARDFPGSSGSKVKRELAQSVFPQTRLAKLKVEINPAFEMNATRSGRLGIIFGNSEENYLFEGKETHRVVRNPGRVDRKYSLEKMETLPIQEEPILFRNYFHLDRNGDQIWFTVACYGKGYCQVLMSASQGKNRFTTQIATETVPAEVNFFSEDEELFLMIVKDPCVLYRWTGTYFDQQDTLDTSGAQSAAVFRQNGNTIIVVAQNLPGQKVHSKVFVRKNRKIELIQLLSTSGALKVETFSLKAKDDFLEFVFVLNEMTSSSVYWWNGKELSLWKSVKDIFGREIVYVNHVSSETFLFLSNKNRVRVYRLTDMSFHLLWNRTFDQEILSVDLRIEPGSMPALMVLTPSESNLFFKLTFFPIDFYYFPQAENLEQEKDPILECLAGLSESLKAAREEMSKNKKLAEALSGKKNRTLRAKSVSSRKALLSGCDVRFFRGNRRENVSMATAAELEKDLTALRNEVRLLTESNPQNPMYRLEGEIRIQSLKADRINLEKLGGDEFTKGKYLSLDKDEKLGKTKAKNLSADNLKVYSVNDMNAEDLIVKNKSVQSIPGTQTLKSLKSKNLRFTKGGKINEILFSDVATFSDLDKTIKGKKTFPRLEIQNLKVKNIDKMPSEKWAGKILPVLKKNDPERPLQFLKLNVKNLRVSQLNGLPWDDFLESLYLPEESDTVSGNLSCPARTKIKNLNIEKLNGIPANQFFTKSTEQRVFCDLKTDSVKTKNLKSERVNGSEESSLKDLLENYNSVTEALDRRSLDRGTNEDRYVIRSEQLIGNVSIPKVIFKNPVNISGTVIDFDTLKIFFWIKGENQTVKNPVEFPEEIFAGALDDLRNLNGRPMDSLIFLNGAEPIKTELVFENVSASAISSAEGADQNVRLENIHFDGGKGRSRNHVAEGTKFLGPVSVNKIRAEMINEIELPNVPSQAINFISSGDAELSEITVHGNVRIRNGTNSNVVNGVSTDEAFEKILSAANSSLLNHASYNSLIVKELLTERFNEMEASSRLKNLANRKTAVDLKVEGNLEVEGVAAEKVNGVPFDEYLSRVVSKKSSENIVKGQKAFLRKIKVVGDVRGTVDGFDALHFERKAFSKTKIQNVTGIYRIEDVRANALVADVVDEIRTENLLFQDDPSTRTLDSDFVFNRLAVAGNLRAIDFMSQCDLNKIVSKKLEEVKKFATLDAKEDFMWELLEKTTGNLSRILTKAVKTTGNETVSGSLVFGTQVSADYLDTKRNLNELDMGYIVENALYRSLHKQNLTREITFKGTISTENVAISGNALVDHVNDIDILNFDSRIVKKNAPAKIKGTKELRNGLAAEYFEAEYLNQAKTDKIVFYGDSKNNDSKVYPPSVCESLKISGELEVEKIDDVDLQELLSRRWPIKSKRQNLGGNILLKGNIRLANAKISKINGIRTEEVIPTQGGSRKIIVGSLDFDRTISVRGKAEVSELDGYDPSAAKNASLSAYENAVLSSDITFAEEIWIEGFCKVAGVNGLSVSNETKNGFDEKILTDDQQHRLEEAKAILDQGETVSSPVVFMHLEEATSLDLNLTRIYGSDVVDYGDRIEIAFRGLKRGSCGLLEKCLCPAQTTVIFPAEGPMTSAAESTEVRRVYKYFDKNSQIFVTVTTTTVSYDDECRQSDEKTEEEETVVSWRKAPVMQESGTRIEKGFLNDVKFFKLGDSVYIVIAFSFDPANNDEKKFRTVVYELMISTGNLIAIDEISSGDYKVLEVFWTPKGVVLVDGADTGSVGIYRFVEAENKFRLLRRVQTHGVLAIKSMRYEKESFIFVVQKQSWPLLILKYDHEDDNYHVKQKRDTANTDLRSDFLSVSIISTSELGTEEGDMFVGVVLSDDSFGLYKYKHIEGFVETSLQEQENVKILQPFQIGTEKYLIGAAVYRPSKVYRFVKQG